MKLTVRHLMDATLVVTQIINEKRPMPQKGKYRLARMHAKLLPEFNIANEQRDQLIKDYDTLQMEKSVNPDGSEIELPTDRYIVPLEKMPEFNEKWGAVLSQVIDVDVQAIPLAQLDLGDSVDGGISAQELVTLGCLVTDDDGPYQEILPPDRRLNIN